MPHAVGLGLAMYALWLLLSGIYEPLLLGFGVASVVLVVVIAQRMDLVDHEGVPMHLHLRIVGYLIWLAKEIAKANIDVARLIIDPRLPISPCIIRVPATQKTDLGRVIHANSITLTPGTVSVELEEGEIIVHAISRQAAEGTLEGAIDRRVSAVEGQ
jgi:multicomponent Na+:H+ antiporter subunit E